VLQRELLARFDGCLCLACLKSVSAGDPMGLAQSGSPAD
jgi:hypothetical protein